MSLNMETRSRIKNLFLLSIPLTAANILQAGSEELDAYIMGRADTQVFAASGIASLSYPIVLFFNGPLYGLTSIMSRLHGEKDKSTMAQMMQQGWIFGTLLCIPQAIIFAMAKPLLTLLKQPEHLIEIAIPYIYLNIASIPAISWRLTSSSYIYSTERQLPIIALSAINLAVGGILNPLLLLGPFGLPKLGLVGYACTTVLQAWLNYLLLTGYLKYSASREGYAFFTPNFGNFKPNAKRFFKMGLFLTAKMAIYTISTIYKQSLIGTFGENSILAIQVSNSFVNIPTYINNAISQAVCISTAQSRGKKDGRALKQYYKIGLMFTFGNSLAFAIVGFAAPHYITEIFLKSPETHDNQSIHNLLYVSAVQLLFDSINLTLAGAFIGTEDSNSPALISLAMFLLVILPITLTLSYKTDLGPLGVGLGYLAGSVLQASVLAIAWYIRLGKLSDELEDTEAKNPMITEVPEPEDSNEHTLELNEISTNSDDKKSPISQAKNKFSFLNFMSKTNEVDNEKMKLVPKTGLPIFKRCGYVPS